MGEECEYTVFVTHSNQRGLPSSLSLFFELFPASIHNEKVQRLPLQKGKNPEQHLETLTEKEKANNDKTDAYTFTRPSLGPLAKIILSHSESDIADNEGWFVLRIKVMEKRKGDHISVHWNFNCDEWEEVTADYEDRETDNREIIRREYPLLSFHEKRDHHETIHDNLVHDHSHDHSHNHDHDHNHDHNHDHTRDHNHDHHDHDLPQDHHDATVQSDVGQQSEITREHDHEKDSSDEDLSVSGEVNEQDGELDTEQLSVSIPSYFSSNTLFPFTIYRMQIFVIENGQERGPLFMEKRYSDFYQLNQRLQTEVGLNWQDFPQKKFFTRFSVQVLEERKKKLEKFIQFLVSNSVAMANPYVRAFFFLAQYATPNSLLPKPDSLVTTSTTPVPPVSSQVNASETTTESTSNPPPSNDNPTSTTENNQEVLGSGETQTEPERQKSNEEQTKEDETQQEFQMPEGFKGADGVLNEYFPENQDVGGNDDDENKEQQPHHHHHQETTTTAQNPDLFANLIAEVQQKIQEDKPNKELEPEQKKETPQEKLAQLDPAFQEKTKQNPLWYWEDDDDNPVVQEEDEDEDEEEEEEEAK